MFPFISSREILNLVLPYCNPALLSKDSLKQIISGVDKSQGSASSIVLECRILPRIEQVDIALCFAKYEGTNFQFKSWLNSFSNGMFPNSTILTSIVKDLDSLIQSNQSIHAIWLEYDGSTSGIDSSKLPSIFVSYKKEYNYSNIFETADALELIFSKYNFLQIDISAFKNALSAFNSLGRVRHIGILFSRDPIILRLCVEMNTENIVEFLRQLNWTGNFDLLKELISTSDNHSLVSLNLDFSDKLGKRIGLEFGSNRDGVRRDYDNFYQNLLSKGLCNAEQYNALNEWVGTSTEFIPILSIPLYLKREISHIKIDVCDSQISTKAYLWVGVRGIVSSM